MAKLGKALMSLLLDKKARAALEAKANAPQHTVVHAPHAPAQPAPHHPSQDEINARLDAAQQAKAARAGTPDRQQLIKDAMQVRAHKAKMLDDLPEDQRRRLKAMAMMSFMKARPDG